MRPVQSYEYSYTDGTSPLATVPLAAAVNDKPVNSTGASSTISRSRSRKITTSKTPSSPLKDSLPDSKRSSLAPQLQPQSHTHTLHPRDINHHVLSLTPTTRPATKNASPSSNMPPSDKSRHSQLGAPTAKSSTRSPLTPKVTVKAPHGHTSTATATSTPPLSRSTKEDTTPVAAHVSATTARSGPRQNRGNSSSNTTPSGTPRPDRAGELLWDNSSRPMAMPPLMRTESHSSSRQASTEPSSDHRSDSTSKFFYASQVKPQPSLSRPGSVQQKAPPTFFYASEAPPSSKRTPNPAASPASLGPNLPVLATPTEGVASKFFYANGTPELSTSHPRPPLAALPSSGSGSSASATSRMMPVRPSTSNSAPGYGTPTGNTRPESPPKASSTNASQSSRSSVIMPTSPIRNQVYSTPSIASTTNLARRRVSIDAPPKMAIGHARTGSAPSIDAFNATKFIMPTVVPSEMASSPLVPGSTPVITMASLLQTADELDDDEEEDEEDEDDDDDGDGESDDGNGSEEAEDDSEEDDSHDDSFGPSKNSEPVSDYVLSARRERKVQDLEIRNTSLEAINKTLERQLRKQSAELRRFRRLSRAGKLPTESSVPNSRAASASAPPSELSDLSEEESVAPTTEGKGEDGEDEEDEEDSYGSEESSSTESGSGSQSDNSNRRKRDERRLQLDLARHRGLLQDSQKMNQSLKRCLNWTEELIKEGQKALAHQVRVSDVQFGYGGRVLSPRDEDDDDTSNQADETLTNIESADSDAESTADTWAKGPQDRDSGIELPVDSG